MSTQRYKVQWNYSQDVREDRWETIGFLDADLKILKRRPAQNHFSRNLWDLRMCEARKMVKHLQGPDYEGHPAYRVEPMTEEEMESVYPQAV